MQTDNIKKEIAKRATAVESYLHKYFDDLELEQDYPHYLIEAMKYSLFIGGKRLRPALVLFTSKLFGKSEDELMPLAAAFEMLHTYSLVHDDLPAMDDDDLRRGNPTCHIKYDEATAVLVGDALLTESFSLLAELEIDATVFKKVLKLFSLSGGMMGMIAGQAADILAEKQAPNEAGLDFIHRHKTGALIKAAVIIPAVVNNATSKELAALDSYGAAIGLAFQVVDDILDEVADEETLGKPVGSDKELGKVTYMSFYGLDEARSKAAQLVEQAKSSLDIFPQGTELLRDLADFILSRDS